MFAESIERPNKRPPARFFERVKVVNEAELNRETESLERIREGNLYPGNPVCFEEQELLTGVSASSVS